MSLTDDQVHEVARLARLGLNETQVEDYARELSSIVDVFDALRRVDTDGVDPMAHPLDLVARLREDSPEAVTQREMFQALAPDADNGVYRVPKVIE